MFGPSAPPSYTLIHFTIPMSKCSFRFRDFSGLSAPATNTLKHFTIPTTVPAFAPSSPDLPQPRIRQCTLQLFLKLLLRSHLRRLIRPGANTPMHFTIHTTAPSFVPSPPSPPRREYTDTLYNSYNCSMGRTTAPKATQGRYASATSYPLSEGCFSDVRVQFRTKNPQKFQKTGQYENCFHFWDVFRTYLKKSQKICLNLCSHIESNTTNPNTIFKITIYYI